MEHSFQSAHLYKQQTPWFVFQDETVALPWIETESISIDTIEWEPTN